MPRDLFGKGPDGAITDYAMEQSRLTSRKVLAAIVKRVGNDECAEAAGISPSHLSTALGAGKSDRNLDDRHIDAILRLATQAERDAYWFARMEPYGKQPAPVNPRAAEQRLRDLEWKVAKRFGQAGVELVEEERAIP